MTFIDIGDFASSTLAYVGYLWSDLAGIIYLVVGTLFGFWVINKIISLVAKRAK